MENLLLWSVSENAYSRDSTPMGCKRKMVTDGIKVGTIVWVTTVPLALWMKPKNAPDLWDPGIVIEEYEDGQLTIFANGTVVGCHKNHVRPFPQHQ